MILGRTGGAGILATGMLGLGCGKSLCGNAGADRLATGGGAGSGLDPWLLIIHIPSPAIEINTRMPTITMDRGIVRFSAEADGSWETEPPGPVTAVEDRPLAGASGMVISCKHKGHATRMPIKAVSHRIRCWHLGQLERNSLINVIQCSEILLMGGQDLNLFRRQGVGVKTHVVNGAAQKIHIAFVIKTASDAGFTGCPPCTGKRY